MKKSNTLVILYFAALLLAASFASCSSTQHGYNYKANAKRKGDRHQSCKDLFNPQLKKNYNSHGTNWY